MIETVPLEQAAAAYAKMMSGKARFRMVLTMGGDNTGSNVRGELSEVPSHLTGGRCAEQFARPSRTCPSQPLMHCGRNVTSRHRLMVLPRSTWLFDLTQGSG